MTPKSTNKPRSNNNLSALTPCAARTNFNTATTFADFSAYSKTSFPRIHWLADCLLSEALNKDEKLI
jgi:hypothetical protein